MGSLCLAAAPILRCESLTTLQNQLLIIPTGLELIFTASLVFTNRSSGRRHLLLTAEGCSYFLLALLEMLSHIVPAVRDSQDAFRIVDITLAATSFLPLFFYMLFVYFLSYAELVNALPSPFRRIFMLVLAFFIPAVVAVNEVANFLGISHRTITVAGAPVLAIGFNNGRDQSLWVFFSSLTLSLLTAFQAFNFCFAFLRLVKAVINKRQIEQGAADEAHLIRGIGWISGGLKLGAIETVVGFAQDGFGTALTRRILRLLSRAFLCIGIAKGVDAHVDFSQIQEEMIPKKKEFRRSRLRQLISNPRHSTFQQLSPAAAAFHAAPRAPPGIHEKGGMNGLPGMAQFQAAKWEQRPRQRVTVHYGGGAPTLQMRFSTLDIPSPSLIAESVKARRLSDFGSSTHRASSQYASSTYTYPKEIPPQPETPPLPMQSPPSQIYNRFTSMHSRGLSEFSTKSSGYPDSLSSLNVVRDLTAQFPGLPPRVRTKHQQQQSVAASYGTNWEIEDVTPRTGTLSASNSLRRKPVPPASPVRETIDPFADDEVPRESFPVSVGGRASPEYVRHISDQEGYRMDVSVGSNIRADNPFEDEYPAALLSGKSKEFQRDSVVSSNIGVAITDDRVDSGGRKRTRSRSQSASGLASVQEDYPVGREAGKSVDSINIPWLERRVNDGNELAIPGKKLTRIKSVGKAPRRYTPTPIHSQSLSRGSIYIEPLIIPPKPEGMPEAVQGHYGSTLRDSGVLGLDDDNLSNFSNGSNVSNRF